MLEQNGDQDDVFRESGSEEEEEHVLECSDKDYKDEEANS